MRWRQLKIVCFKTERAERMQEQWRQWRLHIGQVRAFGTAFGVLLGLPIRTRVRNVRSERVRARVCGARVRSVCCVRRVFVNASVRNALRSIASLRAGFGWSSTYGSR